LHLPGLAFVTTLSFLFYAFRNCTPVTISVAIPMAKSCLSDVVSSGRLFIALIPIAIGSGNPLRFSAKIGTESRGAGCAKLQAMCFKKKSCKYIAGF